MFSRLAAGKSLNDLFTDDRPTDGPSIEDPFFSRIQPCSHLIRKAHRTLHLA